MEKQVKVKPGKYVAAVSGGVDSMVLLDILAKRPELELVVGHFDHGMRPESSKDEQLVRETTQRLGIPYESAKGKLLRGASEETARVARYRFLNKVQKKHKADAIITAHHREDLLETAIINILRGTGRRGISAIATNPDVTRPLLDVSKQDVIDYAKKNSIEWREDVTNEDETYLRNHVRNKVLGQATDRQKRRLSQYFDNVANIEADTDNLLATISQYVIKNGKIDRRLFSSLPHKSANELLVYQLRSLGITNYDRKTIERLNAAIRTAHPRTKHALNGKEFLVMTQRFAEFQITDNAQMG